MDDYSCYGIPAEVLQFFSEQKGLDASMLLRKGYFGIEKRPSCRMINFFRKVTFPLIQFYLRTPELSVVTLLNYDEYAIWDFAVHDKEFRFHRWLLENKLTMPPALVRDSWGNIPALCDFSGIEYLNREVTLFQGSLQEKQRKLNKLVSKNCIWEKEKCLEDNLVPSHQVNWDTVEDRFLKFAEKRVV